MVEHNRRRSLIFASLLLFTLITVVAALVFDVLDLGMRRPDLYNPERDALVEAQWQLAQVVPHGQTASVDPALTHEHMRTVLNSLETAQDVQPEHRERISALRDMVGELEAADRAAEASAQRRRQLYNQITSELQTLIEQNTQNLGDK